MAIQTVNVYSFTVHLKSQQFPGPDKGGGFHVGIKVLAIGATSAAAQAVVKQQFGNDLALVRGGVQLNGPAYTTLA